VASKDIRDNEGRVPYKGSMKRSIPSSLLFLALILGSASTARGQLVRGPEFLINGKTSGAQTDPDVALAADGGFVVVWVDGRAPGPENIMARVFAADGRPRTGDIRVSASEPGFQGQPRVAASAAGDFVVVWSSRLRENGRSRVYGRLFRAGGQPLGERFPLGRGHGREQSEPDVARAPDGRFVVAWSEQDGFSDPVFLVPTTDVFVRRFSAQGTPRAPELRLGNRELQLNPAVAINHAGDFVVAYTEELRDVDAEDLDDVYVHRFSSDGRPLAPARVLAGTQDSFDDPQARPGIALADNRDFVLVWLGKHDSIDLTALWGQRFEAEGWHRGEIFRLTSTTAPPTFLPPSIGLAADGGFVVAWTGLEGVDGDGLGVFARRFAADGSPLSPETGLARWTAGEQSHPALAVAPGGRGLAVWQSQGRDGDSFGIGARRLRGPGR
jgi:hypothetical protein